LLTNENLVTLQSVTSSPLTKPFFFTMWKYSLSVFLLNKIVFTQVIFLTLPFKSLIQYCFKYKLIIKLCKDASIENINRKHLMGEFPSAPNSRCISLNSQNHFDHLQGTVEISVHEFTPFGSSDHIPLCASYP